MVVVLPVPLTPTTSTTAGPPATAERGLQARSRATSSEASSSADGLFGTARLASPAGALDEVDGEGRADIARDERLLDLVP